MTKQQECDLHEPSNPHGLKCRIDGATCNVPDHDASKCEKVVVVDFVIKDDET